MASGEYSFAQFIQDHKGQMEAGGIRPELWGELYHKLTREKFDAGDAFRLVCEESETGEKDWTVLALKDMDPVDEDCVYLIDHMWTFRPHQAREQLESMPELVERLKNLMEIEEDDESCCSDDEVTTEAAEIAKISLARSESGEPNDNFPRHESVDARLCFQVKERNGVVDKIMKKLWQYANTYTVRYKTEVDEDSMPIWYVMDEFGSKIPHSDDANIKVVPLLFAPQNIAYNVLYLTKPVAEDGAVFRDYADTRLAKEHPEWRPLLLLPWFEHSIDEIPAHYVPDDAYFSSGRTADNLPSSQEQEKTQHTKGMRKLKIFTDHDQIIKNLKEVEYELVEELDQADVLWLRQHFHDFGNLCTKSPKALINQFPYESCLNVKDLLAAILMQINNGNGPDWFQKTFNITNELPQFAYHFQKRQKAGMDNTWIVKPWNLARGLDMHVSKDIGQMIRLTEPGPKIVSKYIERPMLFTRPDNLNRVKFDLRYIIFVNSLNPVEAYVYKKFWIRFAINEFVLDNLDDLETHFTVFNYADKSKILQMNCEDFIKSIENIYPFLKWAQIQDQINSVFRGVLEAVSRAPSPRGVAANAQSRAMYGADIMLQWKDGRSPDSVDSVQATLLECNFMPDCERACQYYPDFADTVFKTLFLGEIDQTKVTVI